jgi:hypothetical protein
VKRVTHARLNARTLSGDALESLLAPCLKWCKPHIRKAAENQQVAGLFRSRKLESAAKSVFPLSCATRLNESTTREFDQFLRLRADLAASQFVSDQIVAAEVRRPMSLLVTDWSASLTDGAMTPETDGFIDEEGMPPWDTWVAFLQVEGAHGLMCLLSWVPVWMSRRVDFAIQVDAAESLSWLLVQQKGPVRINGFGKSWPQAKNEFPPC